MPAWAKIQGFQGLTILLPGEIFMKYLALNAILRLEKSRYRHGCSNYDDRFPILGFDSAALHLYQNPLGSESEVGGDKMA